MATITGEPALQVLRAFMRPEDLPDLRPVLERPAWHAQAACRGMGTALFFPERGQPAAPAKAICARCPVADDCRAAATAVDDLTAGIWGGTSPADRQRARRAA